MAPPGAAASAFWPAFDGRPPRWQPWIPSISSTVSRERCSGCTLALRPGPLTGPSASPGLNHHKSCSLSLLAPIGWGNGDGGRGLAGSTGGCSAAQCMYCVHTGILELSLSGQITSGFGWDAVDGWTMRLLASPPCHSTRSDTKISRLLLSLAHAASMIVGRSSETEEMRKCLYSSETASF